MTDEMTQAEIDQMNHSIEWEQMKGRAMSALLREIIEDKKERAEKEHVWTPQDYAVLDGLLNTDERRPTSAEPSTWQKIKRFFGWGRV